jgi:hypothetical protein
MERELTLGPAGLVSYRRIKKTVVRGPAASMQVDECPYRSDVHVADGRELAVCERLVEWLGVADRGLCVAGRDACEVCCRSDSPRRSGVNPVLASLLYESACTVLQRGGMPGCDVATALALQRLAEDNLEWVFPGGDDPPGLETQCQSGGESHPKDVPVPPLSEIIPGRPGRCGPAVKTWAVGVTTSPRKKPTLEFCVESLIRAGWERPWLFIDGGTDLADSQAQLPVTYREEKVGAWSNFYLAVLELLMRQPDADAYLLVQDDALFYDRQNVREYLESCLWPDGDAAAVSLYCPQPYTRRQPGWYALDGRWVWGAQAFVFSNSAARHLATDRQVFEHRWSGGRADTHVDVEIGNWARRQDKSVYYPVPSLVQHIGQTSTLWPAGQTTGKRRANWFLGAAPPLGDASVPPTASGPVHHGVSLSKLKVVTCVFGAQHSPRWLDNYARFSEVLRAHEIDVVAVEGVLPGDHPVLRSGDHTLHFELESVLWHKERLLNLGIASLAADVDAVGWFDADVLVRHESFSQAILAALGHCPIVQPWRFTEWLDTDGQYVPWGNRQRWLESIASRNWTRPPERKIASPSFGHPGLAWAARRETLDAIGGLFDQCPVGSGDTLMAIGFWGDWNTLYLRQYNAAMQQVIRAWEQRAFQVVQGRVGFVDANVSHLWHGSRQSRKYTERYQGLCQLGIDPVRHLEVADNGTWRWASQTPPAIVQYVCDYFAGRREDTEREEDCAPRCDGVSTTP